MSLQDLGHVPYSQQEDLPTLDEYTELEQKKLDASEAYWYRSTYYTCVESLPIDNNTILYEAFYGRGITCNPGAIFRKLIDDPRFAEFTHVWVLDCLDNYNYVVNLFAERNNVIFIQKNEIEYFKYLASAKYLITNSTLPVYFSKRPGQIVINTWHGIPLKTLGFDEPDGAVSTANTIRSFLMTDYFASPVPYMTEVYLRAYKLDGIFEGSIIESGYPRVDQTVSADKDQVIDSLLQQGVKLDRDKKIILYAPTWRGKFSKPDFVVEHYDQIISKLLGSVDSSRYQVLFKPHQAVYKAMMDNGIIRDDYVPAYIDTNALLGITDILISDYSSIFFDYLVTDRPILFYIPDLEQYESGRGLYFTVDHLPGPIFTTLENLCESLREQTNRDDYIPDEKYLACKSKFVCNEDGHASERFIDAVFFGDKTHSIRPKNRKKKLLITTDSVLRNGISSSAHNLLNNIDTSRYDVTFFAVGSKGLVSEYCSTLSPAIRVLYRNAPIVSTPEVSARREWCLDHAITALDEDPLFPSEMYRMEFHRCFGDSKFDVIVDFSGFSAFYANILQTQTETRKLIWMHNVIRMEYERQTDNKFYFKRNLDNIIKLYHDFDGIVSCSRSTMIENRKDLAELDNYDKFLYMPNFINSERILSGAANYNSIEIEGSTHILQQVGNCQFSAIPMGGANEIRFVTTGRLAEAKNQVSLIHAFSKLSSERDDVRLFLIGDGPLRDDLRTEIEGSGLHGKVIMTGNVTNPGAIMSNCDCFILPSLYEGQPMVLLEARTLGLPIIVSSFSTVADSCYPDGQLVIGTSEEEIYEGMKAFLNGDVPNEFVFDPVLYNKECMDLFVRHIEGASQNA